MSKHPYMNLGRFIDRLSELNPEYYIRFAFGGFKPEYFASYRGYYEDIALGFVDRPLDTNDTVEVLLKDALAVIDKTFQGWKGGNYTMDRDSTLWVANPGISSSVAIKEIHDLGYMAIIDTIYIID